MRLLPFILLAASCATAYAQDQVQSGTPSQGIYRSVMPNGRIIFGDKPAPGAKESKLVTVRPSNNAMPGPTLGGASTPRQQALESAGNEVTAAQQNLERAKNALDAGRLPTPDEQMGTVKSGKGGSGGMRTTEAYDQRIRALEQEVSNAQKQLDDAQSKRNDAR